MTMALRLTRTIAVGAAWWCVCIVAASADKAIDKVQRVRRAGALPM
jgi:hypothetical protein